jgi:hypothetical protein
MSVARSIQFKLQTIMRILFFPRSEETSGIAENPE